MECILLLLSTKPPHQIEFADPDGSVATRVAGPSTAAADATQLNSLNGDGENGVGPAAVLVHQGGTHSAVAPPHLHTKAASHLSCMAALIVGAMRAGDVCYNRLAIQ